MVSTPMPVDSRRSGTCRSNNGRSRNTCRAVGGRVRACGEGRLGSWVPGAGLVPTRCDYEEVCLRGSRSGRWGRPKSESWVSEPVSALVRPLPAALPSLSLEGPSSAATGGSHSGATQGTCLVTCHQEHLREAPRGMPFRGKTKCKYKL